MSLTERADVEPLQNNLVVEDYVRVLPSLGAVGAMAIQYGSALVQDAANPQAFNNADGSDNPGDFVGIARDTVAGSVTTETSIPVLKQGVIQNLPVAGSPVLGALVYLGNSNGTGSDDIWNDLTTASANANIVGEIFAYTGTAGFYDVLISVRSQI